MRLKLKGRLLAAWLALACMALVAGEAGATTVTKANLVDLLRNSTSILKASVTGVTDGFDANGLPYTEVTVEIGRTLRGSEQGTYTFRQFGLLAPRLSADGTRKMLPAPSGFPKYADGEEVFLFLYKPAGLTGLRTTVGLSAGKFSFGPGRIENDLANVGLFRNVSLDAGLATSNDARMLETEIGAVNPDTFTAFVERAVTQGWVETCRLWNTSEGKTCPGGTRQTPVYKTGVN
ncbi:MAG: hypothetical protein ACREAA_19965 [Candidatus Polarisedimenticolia bacterium]